MVPHPSDNRSDPAPVEIAWNDPTLDACEEAKCPCGHEVIDHAWNGCDGCRPACTFSPVRALLSSGVVEVRVIPPAPKCDHPGIDHGFAATGICPACGKCKFIGHGPLCWECFTTSGTAGATA